MELRWRDGSQPFDGEVIVSKAAPAEGVRRSVEAVLPTLRRFYGGAELSTYLDWHEHDGWITEAEATSWKALDAAVSSREAFVAASSDDTFVRRAWYPPDHGFLLRWCISSFPEEFGLPRGGESAGQIDVTGPADLVRELAVLLPGSHVDGAKRHFDNTWRG